MKQNTIVYTCRKRMDDTIYQFHPNTLFRRYTPISGLATGDDLIADINRDIRENVSEDAELYRAILTYGYGPIATYIPTLYHISRWLVGDNRYSRPTCAIYDGAILLSDSDLVAHRLLDHTAIRMFGRRMHDEPLSSDEFNRYLEDLTHLINAMRRAAGCVHYQESPALPIIRRYPPRLCTQGDDE